MLNKKHTTGLDTTRRGKKVQSNENPDLSCKREKEYTHYMTPFTDSASTCLVTKWTYTVFQTKPCSTFVEQYPPCITIYLSNVFKKKKKKK